MNSASFWHIIFRLRDILTLILRSKYTKQDGISTIATHYIIINESYVENGSREYVYQIKFKDKSGNEVASTKVVDFYLIDTETLEITDEKTNDWH